ncbi:MAG: ABC transporter substrate-binding protein, partial [Verrucomicrobiota bacterium]
MAACSEAPQVVRDQYPLPQDAEVIPSEPGHYGGTYVIDLSEPVTFNLLYPGSYYSSVAQGMLFNGLIRTDPITFQPEPVLAKSWEIGEDGKT